MIFKQLFEPLSSTYTYLIACSDTGQAILVDPVYPAWERDLTILAEFGLTLAYTLETHVHADHITAALKLKQETGSKIMFPAMSGSECPDIRIEQGIPIQMGSVLLEPIYTPGHTSDHFAYHLDNRVLTGDALLIDGCGRTDFQNGNARTLYESIHNKLFKLPDDTLVYPGHDYNKRHVSSIIQEKERNTRLGESISEAEFETIMQDLNLPYPKFIDYAVPGNRKCGVCPVDLPDRLAEYCHQMTLSPQG